MGEKGQWQLPKPNPLSSLILPPDFDSSPPCPLLNPSLCLRPYHSEDLVERLRLKREAQAKVEIKACPRQEAGVWGEGRTATFPSNGSHSF